jgi:MFS family permease
VRVRALARPAASPLLAPLAHPAFRIAWLGRVAAVFGEHFQVVALAAFALDAAQRSSGWGLILMVRAIPQAALMLVGGVATDRFSPRAVMVAVYVVEAVTSAALFGLAATGVLTLGHLYAYALIAGVGFAFFSPASMSIISELVPREQVRSGNALWNMAFNIGRFAAPPVAGVLVAAAGPAPAIGFNAAAFLVAALLLSRVPARPRPREAPPPPLQALREGIRAARQDPVVWTCILVSPVYTIGSFGATLVGVPAMAKLTMGAGDEGVGLLFGAFGVGALAGTFVTGAVASLRRQGLLGALVCVACGLALGAAALMPSVWSAAAWLVLAGACQAAVIVIFFTLVQTRAPAAARGRVVSLYSFGIFGVTPLSYAIAAVVGDLLGPPAIVLFGGASVVLCGLLILARREMRELE